MFWNRIHLLELWHEKLKEALDNALKEEYNDAAPRILTRLQSRHDKLVAFRTQYSSDLYPFQTTRNTTGLLQYKFSEYPDLRNLRFYQAFLNVFCPGDDIVLLPDIVPLVEINDSSTNIPEDPDVSMLSADLFEERMTDDGLMKFTILTRLTSETVQTWLSEIRLHPLGHSITTEDKLKEIKLSRLHIVKDECDFILNALVPKEQNEKVRSVLKELFWNRVYLLKILLENALTYAPLNEEIKKELHIRYSRLVCFMMHVDQNSLEYFTPSLYEGEHRIYDTYFEGHGKFNPHEKLNFLFQDIWY
jgi:hypothetical protein